MCRAAIRRSRESCCTSTICNCNSPARRRALECFIYDGAFPESPVIESAWYYGTERFAGITPELMTARDVEELLEEDE